MTMVNIKNPHQLAGKTGIASQILYRLLSGERPITKYMAERLAPTLHISPDDLMPNAPARSRIKRDAVRLIDGMDDNEVSQVLPVLNTVAELVRKTGS